jgi:hypothetical protein
VLISTGREGESCPGRDLIACPNVSELLNFRAEDTVLITIYRILDNFISEYEEIDFSSVCLVSVISPRGYRMVVEKQKMLRTENTWSLRTLTYTT